MLTRLFIFLILVYQYCISPFLQKNCRFYPSCSNYAKQVLAKHGVLIGGWMIIKRVAKCQPFHSGGVDLG